MSWFDEAVAVEAQEEYASKSFDLSGEHVVQLKYCYIMPSQSSDAQAFVAEFEYESGAKGRESFWFINKETGTQKKPDGKPTFGSMQVANFLGAMKINANDLKPSDTDIQVFGKDKNMKVFRELFDKKVRVVIQMQEEEDNRDGSIREVSGVIGWFNADSRLNAKEISSGATEPKQIESDVKRCTKLRKLKVSKTEPTQTSKDAPVDNPWAN